MDTDDDEIWFLDEGGAGAIEKARREAENAAAIAEYDELIEKGDAAYRARIERWKKVEKAKYGELAKPRTPARRTPVYEQGLTAGHTATMAKFVTLGTETYYKPTLRKGDKLVYGYNVLTDYLYDATTLFCQVVNEERYTRLKDHPNLYVKAREVEGYVIANDEVGNNEVTVQLMEPPKVYYKTTKGGMVEAPPPQHMHLLIDQKIAKPIAGPGWEKGSTPRGPTQGFADASGTQ